MSLTIVDMQGFKDDENNFILKEIAILKNGVEILHFMVKPPYEWEFLGLKAQTSNQWLSNNYHCIDWKDGFTELDEVKSIVRGILKEDTSIIVKGVEKVEWCKDLFDVIVSNVEDMWLFDEGVYKESGDRCLNRCLMHNGVCTIRNVYRIYESFRE